jgi:DNA-binding CsgD family transcriptional regulator
MKSHLLHQRLSATERLFEAVADEQCLRPALGEMTALLGADIGAMTMGRPGGGARRQFTTELVDGNTPTGRCGTPRRTLAVLDPYRNRLLQRPPGRLYASHELLPREQLEQSTFYRDWLAAAPVRAGCLGYVDVQAGEVCTLAFGRFEERPGSAGFEPEAIAAVEQLMPHLQRVCRLHHQLDSLSAVSTAVMNRYERYSVGVLVVDVEGRVVFRNEAAAHHFARADGLREQGGYLDVEEAQESAALMQAIRENLESDPQSSTVRPRLFTVARHDGAPLSVAVSPYRPGGNGGPGYAVLMVYDPDRPPLQRSAVIQSLYGLSERESDLVCALSAGESLEGFAERSARSLESVRSQLKRIYRKTGTSRQTELVKLVLSGPAAMVQ